MSSRYIGKDVEKRLYAESMGRCMNPACLKELFCENGDIVEKAHIDPYYKTADNTFENLIVLCPNCHTDFDKNLAYDSGKVLNWKKTRKEEVERVFSKKFSCFEDFKKAIVPLLEENKAIYENYYLEDEKSLWEKFEIKVLQNNRKLKLLFSTNLDLIQQHQNEAYSNLKYIQLFIAHVEEFEATRSDDEKIRKILFPAEINSMFGIVPVADSIFPLTESLEILIQKLIEQGKFEKINIGIDRPNICIIEENQSIMVFLDDTPRLRQMYYDYKCFRAANVRLDSLNFALKYIRTRHVRYEFLTISNLREIALQNQKMIFVYEYCLSQSFLSQLSPEENSVIVNLHNWNGESCISQEAYSLATGMNVKLLSMRSFYAYINEIKR